MIEKIIEDSIYLGILEEKFNDVFTKESVNKNLKNNQFTNYFTYVANNQVVAFINYDIMYERAELININVLNSYQNKHIASKLIEYMLEDCKNKKVKSITLEVKITNEKAINLYKKYGFKQVSIRKKYYNGIDGILMEKELM